MMRPYLLLLAWLLLNLTQAALSPLDADETYYWMYARALDWGYYDHPPGVALLISLGKDWLPGALGLRFGHVLTSTATVAGLYFLLDRPTGKWLWLAAGIVFAQPMLQVYGFIATPDGPLLLFTVLYLLAYRDFLRAPSLKSGVVWGLTMAGLLYAKYHGVVLIFFSVLPHLFWLLRQPGAWVAALGGAGLYFPHLYWQYANDFPSFRYHLSGRNDPYQFKYTHSYLLNQLLIFNPLLVYHYTRAFGVDKHPDRFTTACRWLIIGVLLFFLWSTSRGGTEAQWTALLSIPLVYLLFTTLRDHRPEWFSAVAKLCIAGAALLLLARIALALPSSYLPFKKPFDHAPWVERLQDRAGELPVIFENSYRFASLYEFYSGGRPSWTFTNVDYRRNQYDLWPMDSAFQDGTVLLVGQRNWSRQGIEAFDLNNPRDMFTQVVDSFQVVKGINLEEIQATQIPDTLIREGSYPLTIMATNQLGFSVNLDGSLPLHLHATLLYDGDSLIYWKQDRQAGKLPDGKKTLLGEAVLIIPASAQPGPALLEFGLGYEGMPPLRGQSIRREVVIR